MKTMSDVKSWFKKRKPYSKLLAEGLNINTAMLQDLARLISIEQSGTVKEYLRALYIDIIAYSIVLNEYPNFTKLPRKDQDLIITKTQQQALEIAREHEDIW